MTKTLFFLILLTLSAQASQPWCARTSNNHLGGGVVKRSHVGQRVVRLKAESPADATLLVAGKNEGVATLPPAQFISSPLTRGLCLHLTFQMQLRPIPPRQEEVAKK